MPFGVLHAHADACIGHAARIAGMPLYLKHHNPPSLNSPHRIHGGAQLVCAAMFTWRSSRIV